MAADVPAMGTHILVVTDDDKPKADALAEELGMEIFSHRGNLRPPYHTIDSAFATAQTIRAKDPSGTCTVYIYAVHYCVIAGIGSVELGQEIVV